MSNPESRTKLQRMMYGDSEMRGTFISAMGEMTGTAFLIVLGCGGCIGGLGGVPSHLQITLNFGLAVMLVIQIFGHISHAHANPAITAGAVVLGKKSLGEAAAYIVAQILGAIVGYGLLKLGTPTGMLISQPLGKPTDFCVTQLNVSVHPMQGVFIESLATMLLMLVACAVWDKRNENNTDSTALRFGMAVTCLATVFGPYTGCSMNPARSFAPAIWNNNWFNQWIYWLGPIGGSVGGAFFYKIIFGVKDEEKKLDIPESIALNHIDEEKPESV